MNIASLIEALAHSHRNSIALFDMPSGASRTFGELSQAVQWVGEGLKGLGLRAEAKVGLLGGHDEHDVQHLFCDYGVMAAGCIRVPLDPALSIAEQVAQLRDAEASALVFSPALRERADAIACEVSGLVLTDSCSLSKQGLAPQSSTSPVVEYPRGQTLASLSYTGGSTGKPKAVMLTHGNLTCVIQNAVMARGMGIGDLMLNVRPVWPIAGIVVLAHLAAGGTVLMGGKFEPARFLAVLEQYRVAATSLVPVHLIRLLNETDPRRYDLSYLRSLDIGAAAIPPEIFQKALEVLGPKIGVMYGLTEASFSCYQPPVVFKGAESERARRIRSVGRPLFGVEIAIRSPSGTKLNSGEEGEITIRGGHVTKGYWKQQDVTDKAFHGDWFRTGDLGTVDEDGFVSVTGRLKDVIRTGGKSVLPAEVEESLLLHPAVHEAAVVGLPDMEWGEVVAAVVVLHADKAATEDELIEWCRRHLSGFKRPKRVLFVKELPRSHYGKIQRSKVLGLLAEPGSAHGREAIQSGGGVDA